MASIRCPLCGNEVQMRDFHAPPYRRLHARIAATAKIDHPRWSESEGFCQSCEELYIERLEERVRIAEDILSALDALPALEKKIFVFYHYRGLRAEEIALRVHLDPERVREALTRAAKSLHEKLKSHIALARKPAMRDHSLVPR